MLPSWQAHCRPGLADARAQRTRHPVDLADWAVEPKWDGWRCLARIDHGALRLTSRWRNDLSAMFPELGDLPAEILDHSVLLDGEVVALRADGSQDFHALTSRRPRDTRVAFMCFDVLHLNGHDLMADPYAARRHELEQMHLRQDRWLTTPSLQGIAGAALYSFTLGRGWEGVVAKRIDSAYQPAARNGAWLKAKHHARDLQADRSRWDIRPRAHSDEPLISPTAKASRWHWLSLVCTIRTVGRPHVGELAELVFVPPTCSGFVEYGVELR